MRTTMPATLVIIEALHEFCEVYERRVFVGGNHQTDASLWGCARSVALDEKHKAKTPQFADIIKFQPTSMPITCEVA